MRTRFVILGATWTRTRSLPFFHDDSGRTPLAREGVVRRPSASTDPTTSRPSLVGQSASAASLQPLPPRRPRAEPSRVERLKRHFLKSGFSGRVAGVLSGASDPPPLASISRGGRSFVVGVVEGALLQSMPLFQ